MTNITATTRLYGLVGSNISRSKSFVLHNQTMKALDLDALYLCFETEAHSLQEILKALDAIQCQGANITLPFKEDIIPYLGELSSEAQAIGAVNTIRKTKKGWKGYNTDAFGFAQSLLTSNITVENRPIYLWGAGGAARAVCYALANLGVDTIHCWNRHPDRLNELRTLVAVERYQPEVFFPQHAILINCTPLESKEEYPALPQFNSTHSVIDLIYRDTALLSMAKEAGAEYLNGSKMLLYQAVKAFELWFPNSNPTMTMTQIYWEQQW